MTKTNHLSVADIIKIKLQEFYWFYKELPEYYCYINHLNEIVWLNEDVAVDQHEFYLLDPHEVKLIEKYVGGKPGKLKHFEDNEKGIRRVFRRYLCQKNNLPLSEELDEQSDEIITTQQVENLNLIFDPEKYKKGTLKTGLIITTAILLITVIIWVLLNLSKGGDLIVSTGYISAEVYIDSVLAGKSNHVINNIPYGNHLLEVKKDGYSSRPIRQKILISKNAVLRLDVELIKKSEIKYGILAISTNVNDAKLYIDEIYLGNLKDYPHLRLESGKHKVQIKKDFYKAENEFNWIDISTTDTVKLNIQMNLPEQTTNRIVHQQQNSYLEVISNVAGATIVLNNKPTKYTTDYIFTNLSRQKYKIELQKKGYKFSPDYIEVDLRKNKLSKRARFEGQLVMNQAKISVDPVTAKILVDGELKGEGYYSGNLSIGEHLLELIVPKGYSSFKPQKIKVLKENPFEKQIKLIPHFTYSAHISDVGNLEKNNCTVLTGYNEHNRGFSYSEEAGPEIIYSDELKNYFWEFGFAFPYRASKGNDALLIKFNFNYSLKLVSNVKLIIYAARSDKKYPRTFSNINKWRVLLNHYKLHDSQQIFNKADLNVLTKYEWDITDHLKYSNNTLEISTTDDNNIYFYIKDIIITNK